MRYLMICLSFLLSSAAMAEAAYTADDWLAAKADTILLDVRSVREYENGAIENSVNIPVFQLKKRMQQLGDLQGKTVVVVCEVGGRARMAAEFLEQKGVKTTLLAGHMREWRKEKRPMVMAK